MTKILRDQFQKITRFRGADPKVPYRICIAGGTVDEALRFMAGMAIGLQQNESLDFGLLSDQSTLKSFHITTREDLMDPETLLRASFDYSVMVAANEDAPAGDLVEEQGDLFAENVSAAQAKRAEATPDGGEAPARVPDTISARLHIEMSEGGRETLLHRGTPPAPQLALGCEFIAKSMADLDAATIEAADAVIVLLQSVFASKERLSKLLHECKDLQGNGRRIVLAFGHALDGLAYLDTYFDALDFDRRQTIGEQAQMPHFAQQAQLSHLGHLFQDLTPAYFDTHLSDHVERLYGETLQNVVSTLGTLGFAPEADFYSLEGFDLNNRAVALLPQMPSRAPLPSSLFSREAREKWLAPRDIHGDAAETEAFYKARLRVWCPVNVRAVVMSSIFAPRGATADDLFWRYRSA